MDLKAYIEQAVQESLRNILPSISQSTLSSRPKRRRPVSNEGEVLSDSSSVREEQTDHSFDFSLVLALILAKTVDIEWEPVDPPKKLPRYFPGLKKKGHPFLSYQNSKN